MRRKRTERERLEGCIEALKWVSLNRIVQADPEGQIARVYRRVLAKLEELP